MTAYERWLRERWLFKEGMLHRVMRLLGIPMAEVQPYDLRVPPSEARNMLRNTRNLLR